MTLSIAEVAQAREFLLALLSDLGLAGHRFDLEPAGGGVWGLVVECQAADGWQIHRLAVSKQRLEDARVDLSARRALEEEISEGLSDCVRQA